MEQTPPAADSLTPGTRRIAMRLAYDGTDFLGWQRQATGRTVQGVLEEMLGRLAGDRPVVVTGAGRTDSGVHAAAQVAHADIATRLHDAELLHKLGRMVPDDLAVRALATVDEQFHARYQACRRSYRYTILLRADPFRARYGWRLEHRLDRDLLDAAGAALIGGHDFTALSKHNPDTPDPICEIVSARWTDEHGELHFDVTADRFLYGMVRQLVGIQLDVARGRRQLGEIAATIDSRDRARQSPAVPGHGLSLVGVEYPVDPFAGLTALATDRNDPSAR
jgi:tRNA pseudouridine38-40 synthase